MTLDFSTSSSEFQGIVGQDDATLFHEQKRQISRRKETQTEREEKTRGGHETESEQKGKFYKIQQLSSSSSHSFIDGATGKLSFSY